jgi:hypothetical protein
MSKTLLEDLGRQLGLRLEDGESLGIRQGEASLTDHALLEICRAASPGVKVWKVQPPDEPHVGADVDMLISTAGRTQRYLAQAKRSDTAGKYAKLGHRVAGRRQLDILRDAAEALGAVPIYILYNHRMSAVPWHCCEAEEADLLGWTVVGAGDVGEALLTRGCRTFEFLHSRRGALPVRCLLCPKAHVGRLVSAVGTPHDAPQRLFEELRTQDAHKTSFPIEWYEAAGYHRLARDRLPAYALLVGDAGPSA